MDNLETKATFGQRHRTKINKTKQNKTKTTQKTKRISNTDPGTNLNNTAPSIGTFAGRLAGE